MSEHYEPSNPKEYPHELRSEVARLRAENERLSAEVEYVKGCARAGLLKWREMAMVVPGHLEDAAKGFDEDNPTDTDESGDEGRED